MSPTAHTKKPSDFPRCRAARSSGFALLRVADVSFSYPRSGAAQVLHGVSVDVPRGVVLGLLGPNGSGKTTLLRLMSGTLAPLSGNVTIDGDDVRRLSRRELARRIAVVPQDTHSTFDFTV